MRGIGRVSGVDSFEAGVVVLEYERGGRMFVVALMQVGKKRNCISMIEDWLYRKTREQRLLSYRGVFNFFF